VTAPFPLIEVSGDPAARGRDYGRQAAGRVARSAALYRASLDRMGLGDADRRRHLDALLQRVEAFDPDYVTEMRGIAEGAGVDLFDVVLVNCRTEMLQLAENGDRLLEDPDGCTGFVVLPGASADGAVIHAQNWDWKAECAETGVVLLIRREDGPDILTFTEAGALARAGVNGAGIAITANYLECDRDYRRLGVPLPLIRRKVLEQTHYALAIRAVACTPKSASNNMMLSCAGGMAIDIECAPDEAFLLQPDRGLLVHANHWRSPVALAKLRETGLASVPDSPYRDARVEAALGGRRGRITVADAKAALFDDWGSPWSVCRPPMAEEDGGNLSATVAMIVIRPDLGEMEIAPLPAQNRTFTRYALAPRAASAHLDDMPKLEKRT
jgi:isopenicillin-N N-acyltransferase-like protein